MDNSLNSGLSKNAKAAYWMPFVKQWHEAQETSKSFCQRLNLNLDQFNYWRKKLSSKLIMHADKFVQVEVEAAPTKSISSILIELPGHIKMTLENIDSVQLNQIFNLLGITHD